MKDILSPDGRAALESFALANVLLAFDFDGTLAPIVEDPAKARIPPSTRALLTELTGRYPCAIVSGRAREDVLRLAEGLPLLRIVGNHGAEGERQPRGIPRAVIAQWERHMSRACACLPGVLLENKTWSLAVHYRRARRRAAARDHILAAAAAGLRGARVVHGKAVVNLVHPAAVDKGGAVLDIQRQLCCDAVIYVGDDVTDEDVFSLDQPGRLLAVRVGRGRPSHAQFYLARQARMDELLATLLALRPPTRRRAAR